MRTTTFCTLLLTTAIAATVAGCEHKSKHDDPSPATPTGHGPGSAHGDMAAEPVAKDPNAGGGGADAVRPPTAADLADYTKDITGSGPLVATITTNKGAFHCELFPDKAPVTVANFIGLATGKKAWRDPASGAVQTGKPFYNGLTFHRVIPQFMIQGGDPEGTGRGGPGYTFDDETEGGAPFQIGSLAMANAGSRGGHGTNGSQFFITEIAPDWLNGKHTIFGQCKEADLVKTITALHGPGDKPTEPVTIDSVTFAHGG